MTLSKLITRVMSETVIPTAEIGGNFWSLEVSSKKVSDWNLGYWKCSQNIASVGRRPASIDGPSEYATLESHIAAFVSHIEEVKQRLVEIWQRSNAAFFKKFLQSESENMISVFLRSARQCRNITRVNQHLIAYFLSSVIQQLITRSHQEMR